MSDQDGGKVPETPAASPDAPVPQKADDTAAPADSGQGAFFGVPMASFVRHGGTTSGKHDNMVAEWRHEDEVRRKEQDEQRKIASVPVEFGGAKMYNRQTGSPQETAKVLLDYLNEAGEPLILETKPIQCLADIISGMNHNDPTDLALIILCPYCWNRGIPAGRCQIHALQSNRAWHLDLRGQGELLIFEGQPYRSAGIVMDSEPMKCGNCGWKIRVHRNKVYTEKSGS